MMIAELIAQDPIRLVDGTLIACANYPGCAARSEFAGYASFGYCPSKSQYVWGMRLVVICDIDGVPIGYDLVGPKTGAGARERPAARRRLTPAACCSPTKASWGKELDASMELIGVRLDHPRAPPARQAPARRDRQSPHPPGDRVACSPTSNARCASSTTSPKPSPASSNASPNDCSHSPSACSSTPSSAAHPEHSPPTTDAKPTSSL